MGQHIPATGKNAPAQQVTLVPVKNAAYQGYTAYESKTREGIIVHLPVMLYDINQICAAHGEVESTELDEDGEIKHVRHISKVEAPGTGYKVTTNKGEKDQVIVYYKDQNDMRDRAAISDAIYAHRVIIGVPANECNCKLTSIV